MRSSNRVSYSTGRAGTFFRLKEYDKAWEDVQACRRAGGIISPDTAKEKPQQGTVVAVGPGKLLDDGTRAKPSVKVGDTVLFAKYSGSEVTVDGKELMIMRESDILAKLE